MTKCDVAVWFCRVVALVGILSAIISLLSALIGWRTGGMSNFFYPIPTLALYFFVWLGARGLGTELAAEGEHGAPIESGAALGALLARCVGLWIFLQGMLGFGVISLTVAYQHFATKSTYNPPYLQMMMPYLIGEFIQSVLGFGLAFTPRLRLFFRK